GAWNVYVWNNAATGSLFTARTGASWGAFSGWRNLLVGDFNGDGKSDVAAQSTNGMWYFGLANGASSGAILNTVAGNQWYTPNNYNHVFAADVNGDGKTDIVGVSTNTWYVQRSSGSSFVTSIWGTSPAGGWSKVMAQDNSAVRSGNVLQFAWDGSWDYGQSTGSSFAFRR
ncbi:MAG: VCBS repeat-containing protein, partial [Blastocatellia bacterium]|nr:VCBS repeat-containing protein [Blastocatellia bacterium]